MVEQSQNPAEDPGAQRRRSTRIVQAIPLTVTGEDALGQMFRERTSTLMINCHGCRYQSKHYVPKNSFINMEIPHPDPTRKPRRVRARVTWIQRPRTVRELFQVGAELEVPGNCWGVAFPPDDWFPWPEEDEAAITGPEAAAAQSSPAAPLVTPKQALSPAAAPPAIPKQVLSPAAPPAAKPVVPAAATPSVLPVAPGVPPALGSTSADKVRVMTRPGVGAELSATVSRQMARLIEDAKQQVTQAARSAATQAVALETKQLLTALNSQLLTAAQSAVEAAAAHQARKDSQSAAAETTEAVRIALLRIEESREASVSALAETQEAGRHALAEQARAETARTAESAAHAEEALRLILGRIDESREAATRAVAEQAQRVIARANEAGARTDEGLQQILRRIEESGNAGLRAVAEQAEREIARTAEAGTRTEAALQQTLQRIEESREAGLRALGEQARLEVARVAEMAIVELSGRIAATGAELREHAAREVESGRTQLATLQAHLAEAVSGAGQRYQTEIEGRIETARLRLEELDGEAGQVEAKIAEAVELNRASWRQRLESDMAVVGTEWNDMIASSVRSSTEGLAARLDEQARGAVDQAQHSFSTRLETQLAAARAALDSLQADAQRAMDAIRQTTAEAHDNSERVLTELRNQTGATAGAARETFETLRSSFDESAAEARRNVNVLRQSLDGDAHRAGAILAEIKEAAARVQDYSAQLEQLSRSTAAELQRRFETILATQSEQLHQGAETIVAEVTGRLVPTFEEAGQRSVEKFLREMEEHLEKKLVPQFDRVTEVLSLLAVGEEHAEATLHAVRDRLRETSDQYVHEAVARMQGTIAQLEHDYQASSRQALARLTAELDEKATDTTHTTFEALLKASDWYQKKAQTSMQAALERAVDQASAALREKAAEMSSLFATELDHYSRSYAEHTEGLLEESSRKSVEATRGRLDEAAATTLAGFGDESLRVAEQELRQMEAAGELSTRRLFADMEALAHQSEKQVAESLSRIDARAAEMDTRLDTRAGETESRVADSLGRMDAVAGEKERRAAESLDRIRAQADESEAHFAKMLAALEVAAGEVRAAEEAASAAARERMNLEAQETFDAFQARLAERMVDGVNQARRDLEVSLQPILESWRNERDSQHRDWINALEQLGAQALDQHQHRLVNVSNSWMATSVATLSEHSQNVLDQLAHAAEQRLRDTCAQVFAGLGDALRQRMLGLSADLAPSVPSISDPQKSPEKQK